MNVQCSFPIAIPRLQLIAGSEDHSSDLLGASRDAMVRCRGNFTNIDRKSMGK